MQRRGLNLGGYRGETIPIQELVEETQREALGRGWEADTFLKSEGLALSALRRRVLEPRSRLYLSAGIHGDEPAGPLAMRELIREDEWPADAEILVCSCLNPAGFCLNRRENAEGMDLNRDYRHLRSPEVRAHVEWLRKQGEFNVALVLHEDWEANGFYLYELNPEDRPSLSPQIIAAVSKVCPIESSGLVDGWTAINGVVRPQVNPADRPQWPESIFLIAEKTRHSYTLEAPSDYPLETRVNALVVAVRTVLENFDGGHRG